MEAHKIGYWVGGNVKVNDPDYIMDYRAMHIDEILEKKQRYWHDEAITILANNILTSIRTYDSIAERLFKGDS